MKVPVSSRKLAQPEKWALLHKRIINLDSILIFYTYFNSNNLFEINYVFN